MYSKEVLKIVKRLQNARLELMRKQPFYAVLLLHMQFSIDPMCETAYTDGTRIVFCPDFLEKLSDQELEFVLMHEVMHVALNHCHRMRDQYDFDDYNTACDIVVNSNILYSCNMDLERITLKDFGVLMHAAPDGKEGYEYSAEEVYEMLHDPDKKKKEKKKKSKYVEDDEETAAGKIDADDQKITVASRNDGGFDDHTFWNSDDGSDEADQENGQDEDTQSDAGESEEEQSKSGGKVGGSLKDQFSQKELENVWLHRIIEATEITNKIISISKSHKGYGGPPLMAQRVLKKFTEPQTDWREILQDFVQEEICDYSFDPPDRRYQDSMFLLPDFNVKDSLVKNVWFLIDTSGSIGDNAISAAYSEICAAIDQFGGKLDGWISFTESYVTEPIPFSSVDDVMAIKPVGGGGNDFSAIFRYMNENMVDDLPAYIVIITDGYDKFPAESEANGIPVLWLINNEEVNPPWGKVARIKIDERNVDG